MDAETVIDFSPLIVVFPSGEPTQHAGPPLIPYVSLVIAAFALWFNASRALRRPRIQVDQGVAQSNPQVEGMMIIATARYRPIQVTEIGIVVLPRKLWQPRRVPEWFNSDTPPRQKLTPWAPNLPFNAERSRLFPIRLEDGESARVYERLDHADEWTIASHDGVRYVYVMASGDVYLKREPPARHIELHALPT